MSPALAAPPGASRAELARATRRKILTALVVANLLGGLVVFVFLTWVLPAPVDVRDPAANLRLNALAFALYLPLAVVVGSWWGLRRAGGPNDWLLAGRAPDAAERELTLRTPSSLLRVHAALWGAGVVIFAAINTPASRELAAMIAITALMGGVMTSTMAYLMAERLMRPVVAQALAGSPVERPAVPGITARLVIAWSLGTGLPLLGILLVAWYVLSGEPISASRLAVSAVFLALAALAVGLLAMVMVARSIAEPLAAMRRAVQELRSGRTSVSVRVDDSSEVGLLQAGFNHLASGLREHEQLRDLFARHVGPDVARQAVARGVQLGGEVRDAAVLFVDLVGSTAFATTHSPTAVVGLLNRFFTIVIEVVDQHGGWVNKFEGDGALCVFGAPLPLTDPSGAALHAGRALGVRLTAELEECRARLGISAGPVVAGNVGSAERYEYTVIGDPVNEAARLSELARDQPGLLLGSEAAVSQASRDEAGKWRFVDAVTLRGRSRPTRLAVPAPDARAT